MRDRTTSPLAVSVSGATKYFGEVVALDAVYIAVGAGEIRGLVGPNGAGKTTLMGLLLGLTHADAGRVEVLGQSLGRDRGTPLGVAGFVDAPALYPMLTARQNVVELARLSGMPSGRRLRQQATDVLDAVGLADVADDRTRGFSLGMRQRLGLAAALVSRPSVLVLDEPLNGLDPVGKRHVTALLHELATSGTTVLVSSHRMDDVASLAATVTILDRGSTVFDGAVHELTNRHRSLEYRVVVTDLARAHEIASALPVAVSNPARSLDNELRVTALPTDLDLLVLALARAGVGIRELAPTVPPLEAAYLALTGRGDRTGPDFQPRAPLPAGGERLTSADEPMRVPA